MICLISNPVLWLDLIQSVILQADHCFQIVMLVLHTSGERTLSRDINLASRYVICFHGGKNLLFMSTFLPVKLGSKKGDIKVSLSNKWWCIHSPFFLAIEPFPSRHNSSKWRPTGVNATSSRRIDISITSFQHCVPAGFRLGALLSEYLTLKKQRQYYL